MNLSKNPSENYLLVPKDKLCELYRLADIGKLALGIFHELMKPLQQLVTYLSYQESTDFCVIEFGKKLESAVLTSRHMGEFLSHLKTITHNSKEDGLILLSDELGNILKLIEYSARQKNISFKLSIDPRAKVFGNRFIFSQIITNILLNAIDASRERKSKVIKIEISSYHKNMLLKVTDFGCGIKKHILKKIFDPFFSTKETKENMGMGLWLTKSFIEEYFHGSIKVTSTMGKGSTFYLYFPRIK